MKKISTTILTIAMSLCFFATGLIACQGGQCRSGHKWSNGELTVAATADAEGLITYTCMRCSEKKEETIAAGTEVTTRADLETAVVSAAWAYFLKKEKVQYDSTHLTKVSGFVSGISRHSKEVAPEYGTADKTLYTVCSAYVANAYREGIGRQLFEDRYSTHALTVHNLFAFAENQPEEGYQAQVAGVADKKTENDKDTAILRWIDYNRYEKLSSSERKTYSNMGVLESTALTDWYKDGEIQFKYNEAQNKYVYYLNGKKVMYDEVLKLVKDNFFKKVDGEYVNLRVGDVLLVEGHCVLYVGNGYYLESGGDKYDIENGFDRTEATGSVYGSMTMAEKLVTKASAAAFFGVVRPLDFYAQDYDGNMDNDIVKYDGEELVVPETTNTRLENPAMEIDRTVNVKDYGSVEKGKNITYSIKITNYTNDLFYQKWINNAEGTQVPYQDVKVTESVPQGAEFVSATGEYTINDGRLTWIVDVPVGETVELTYTVKAIGEIGYTIVNEGGFVGNIPSNTIKTVIGSTKLNQTQVDFLAGLGNSESTDGWADEYGVGLNFANGIYRAMGIDLTLPTVDAYVQNLFKPTVFDKILPLSCFRAGVNGPLAMYVPQSSVNEDFATYKDMLINGYYGGYRMYTTDHKKLEEIGYLNYDVTKELNNTILDFRVEFLEVGDIVVYATAKDRGDATLNSEMAYTNVLIYVGNNTIIGMESFADGTKNATIYKDGSEASILINAYNKKHDVFFALRPSQAKLVQD